MQPPSDRVLIVCLVLWFQTVIVNLDTNAVSIAEGKARAANSKARDGAKSTDFKFSLPPELGADLKAHLKAWHKQKHAAAGLADGFLCFFVALFGEFDYTAGSGSGGSGSGSGGEGGAFDFKKFLASVDFATKEIRDFWQILTQSQCVERFVAYEVNTHNKRPELIRPTGSFPAPTATATATADGD